MGTGVYNLEEIQVSYNNNISLLVYNRMVIAIFSYEQNIYKEWTEGVGEACGFNLSLPLLTRNEETKLIAVNFDPQVGFILNYEF